MTAPFLLSKAVHGSRAGRSQRPKALLLLRVAPWDTLPPARWQRCYNVYTLGPALRGESHGYERGGPRACVHPSRAALLVTQPCMGVRVVVCPTRPGCASAWSVVAARARGGGQFRRRYPGCSAWLCPSQPRRGTRPAHLPKWAAGPLGRRGSEEGGIARRQHHDAQRFAHAAASTPQRSGSDAPQRNDTPSAKTARNKPRGVAVRRPSGTRLAPPGCAFLGNTLHDGRDTARGPRPVVVVLGQARLGRTAN